MNYVLKIIVLVVILLIFLRLFLPSSEIYEHFNQNAVIRAFNNTSTMLYSQTENDEEYMKALKERSLVHTELMIMNRCIELTSSSIEPLIDSLRGKFFISNKLVQQYTDFSNIQESLKKNFIQLYKNSVKQYKNIKFNGPIYVIITQYPKMLTVNEDCEQIMNELYEHDDNTNFSPIKIDNPYQNVCDVDRYIEAEIYILMPAHNSTGSPNIVGPANNKRWPEIRSSMSILLEPSSDARVINVRSKNNKCYTTCGNIPNRILPLCGARNGQSSGATINVEEAFTSPSIYQSSVVNKSNNQKYDDVKVDIVNLYVINTSVMNDIICPSINNNTPCTQFLVNNLNVQPIETALEKKVEVRTWLGNNSPPFTSNTSLRSDYAKSHWETNVGWKVNASSVLNSSFAAWKGFNKTTLSSGDCWHSAKKKLTQNNPQWISIEYPYPVSISSYEITSRNNGNDIWFPTKWQLQGSDNGKIWVGLEPLRIVNSWNMRETKSFSDEINVSSTKYKFFRLLIQGARKNNSNGDSSYVAIGNWNLMTIPHEQDYSTMQLTEEEAMCYKENTPSIRDSNMSYPQLINHWNFTSGVKDKICKDKQKITTSGTTNTTTLPNIANLYAHYTADSWSFENNRWEDISGNNRHSVLTKGVVNFTYSKDPSGKIVKALEGDYNTGIRFTTAILPEKFTLFHLTRYTGGRRGRIFHGLTGNWLSGFWGGKSGVAHHNGWLTQSRDSLFGDEWVVSTSQNNIYRANGVNRNINTPATTMKSTHLTINDGVYRNEVSNWACSEVIVYDRLLKDDEIEIVEKYMSGTIMNSADEAITEFKEAQNKIMHDLFTTQPHPPLCNADGCDQDRMADLAKMAKKNIDVLEKKYSTLKNLEWFNKALMEKMDAHRSETGRQIATALRQHFDTSNEATVTDYSSVQPLTLGDKIENFINTVGKDVLIRNARKPSAKEIIQNRGLYEKYKNITGKTSRGATIRMAAYRLGITAGTPDLIDHPLFKNLW